MTPIIAIPAAGASRRMRGRDKLMERVDGVPLLRRQAERAIATGCPVVVLLPTGEDHAPRQSALTDLDLRTEFVKDAREGMSGSLRRAAYIAGDGPLGILLPDVPGVTTDDMRKVLDAFLDRGMSAPTRATDPEGRPGTPLFLPARLVPRLAALTGDDGGRSILAGEEVRMVPFSDTRATRDLDTPEAWSAWRAEQGDAN